MLCPLSVDRNQLAHLESYGFPISCPEIQCVCQALPVPIVARFSPQAWLATPTALLGLFKASEASTVLFQTQFWPKVILDELFGFSLLRCSTVFSSLVSDRKIDPSRWSSVYIAALQQVLFNTAVPFSRQRCVVRILSSSSPYNGCRRSCWCSLIC